MARRKKEVCGSMPKIVEVENLVKRYKKAQKNAVDGISFEVEPGQLFALLGPNGAGKTTTISILSTTLALTAGSVRIAGHDITREASAVRRQLGIIFQKPSLDLNLSGEENVRFHAVLYGLYPWRPTYRSMPTGYRRQVADLASVVGIGDEIFRPVKTLSGGQKRRLDLGVALVGDPELLFLDEPTTGFDPAARRAAWEMIRGLRGLGKTILLTTHYLDEAQSLADRVAIVKDGLIVAEGPPAELSPHAPRYRVAYQRNGDRVEIETEDPTALLHRLTSEALERGERLHNLTVTRPTLEEVYLELTAEEESAAKAPQQVAG